MTEILKSRTKLEAQLYQNVESGEVIITNCKPTELTFCVLNTGAAVDGDSRAYDNYDLVRPCESLTFDY